MREFAKNLKRVVIKVGSSSITHENGDINLRKIFDLCWQLSDAKNHGYEVVLVSSGAIAAGSKRLNLKDRPNTTALKQAASAVGQVALMNTYNRILGEFSYHGAQILLTKHIETDELMLTNAKNAFKELFNLNVIPIINENDTISTFEIKFGDNDTLSAIVSRIIDADLLVLLSDIDGLYTCDPRENSDAELIKNVDTITEEIKSCAQGTNSKVGTGGMVTKISAANLCMEKGIDVVLANGKDMKIIKDILEGKEIGTYFRSKKND
ncbi:glutamate 5-kinase [Miniphocaeibacter halophilus]|uniref:Glutamate 5-kinase n=1 Tax=Miniphocaeibacter halophilus TaxID=2931922 RepID=A0AC61MQ58_9FIRM|nr:glutamate 5-kinase [Miniphocaeibacter halophilus]QQK07704.1 glutamate 5-kinase [Miniphocaeibacter halophilus]